MSAPLDCIPCLCRETVTAVRAVTADTVLQNAILGEALFHLAMRDQAALPEALAADLQSLIATRIGHPVPPLGKNRACPHIALAGRRRLLFSHENRHPDQ